MRVVLDTNVLLSGLMAPKGVPGRIVAAWIDAQYEFVMSLEQVDEVARFWRIRRSASGCVGTKSESRAASSSFMFEPR